MPMSMQHHACFRFDRQGQLCNQAQGPKKAQGVVDQVLLLHGLKPRAAKVGDAVGGIEKHRCIPQHQCDCIQAEIAAPEVRFQVIAISTGQIEGPAAQHQAGHVPRFIQHDTGPSIVASQSLRQLEGPLRDHQIKIRRSTLASDQGISDRAPDKG